MRTNSCDLVLAIDLIDLDYKANRPGYVVKTFVDRLSVRSDHYDAVGYHGEDFADPKLKGVILSCKRVR